MLARARLWLRSLVLRRRLEAEMQDEMAAHIDRSTERLIARGLSASDARQAAAREFGNVSYHKEEGRRARGARWLEALVADSRFAIRHFRRNPGATLTMLVVLAIGMSISTALFSFLHAYANQPPLGVTLSDDLVRIRGSQLTEDGLMVRRLSAQELEAYQGLTNHFTAVAGYANNGVTIQVDGDATRVERGTATFVTPNYFDVLKVRPVIGAGLPRTDSANGAQLVAVIGYAVWEQFFARSPSAIGATLTVEGVPVTIVGVAPPRFAGLNVYSEMKVWMPIASRPLIVPGLDPGIETFGAAAQLAPGTDLPRATAAARVIAQRVTAELQQTNRAQYERRVGADVVGLLATNGDPQFDSQVVALSIGATILGTLILLVTCTNVSALQTGLALMRRREIAIRLSMGAGRRRIIRQLLTETIILATLAGGAALGVVWLLQRLFVTRIPDLPIEVAVNGPALAFVFGLALAVGTLFGLSPALHATRLTVSSALKDSTASIAAPRVRLQRGLVVAQIALTQPLIVGLGLTVVIVWGEYRRMGLNESADQIVSMRMRPAAVQSPDSAPQWAGEIRGLRDQLRSTPSVEGAVQDLRMTLSLENYRVHPEDRIGTTPQQLLRFSAPMVAPGYFGVMGERLILGRDFLESDGTPPSTPEHARTEVPIIIGSDLAAELWSNANPLGRRLESAVDSIGSGFPLRVVGVLDQPRDEFTTSSDGYRVFFPPDSARAAASLALLIRTSGDAKSKVPTIQRVVQEGTTRLTVADTRTVADLEREMRDVFALVAKGLGTAGFVTLFLAAIGLYAVVSFAVGQRTSEIAVRMAVGAREHQIVGRFVSEGVRLGIVGLIIGLPLSLVGLRFLLSTAGAPPVPIGGIAVGTGVVVLLVALTATWIPARRAAGVDPATVLRRD